MGFRFWVTMLLVQFEFSHIIAFVTQNTFTDCFSPFLTGEEHSYCLSGDCACHRMFWHILSSFFCNSYLPIYNMMLQHTTWAATWQNQQNECAPSEDSDQPGHPPSLIRVFAVRMKKAWVLSYPLSAQRRLWSDWADAQADLSLRWAHSHFVGFDM